MKSDPRLLSAVFILLAGSISGCATIGPASEPCTPCIVIEESAEDGFWEATWHLAEPTRELRFEREGAGFRSRVFESLTPGYKIERDGAVEVLRTDGEPARTLRARFPEFSIALQKEYAFFQRFSDGSVAIYTGHLVARPAETGDDDCAACYIRKFRLRAPEGSSVLLDGRFVGQQADWEDREGQGTYAYLGGIDPLESAEMITIVDPAVSEWLQKETREAMPRLFSMYTERFGVELSERPTVLFNQIDNGHSGYSNAGGTLPGQIILTLDGAAWKERSNEALKLLFHFLAHEAVHMWNGQTIHYKGSADAWMHEGSADAFAQRTLLELGIIDVEGFLDYQTAALNECRKGLGGFPLREASARDLFGLYYSCGNVIALATEAMAGERDLFAFWKQLIERTLNEGEYDAEDYFTTMAASGVNPASIARLRTFVETSADGDDLVEMLRANGIAVEKADPPQGYGQSIARDALFRLMGERCRGEYGFNMSLEGMKLKDPLDCGSLPAGATVSAIAGHDVRRAGHRVWDAMHDRCGSGGTIPVTVRASGSVEEPVTVDVPCTEPFPGRPAYLKISSRPRVE